MPDEINTHEIVIEYATIEEVRRVGEKMRIRYRTLLDRLKDE